MDDDSCVMKFIEIVPLSKSADSPDLSDLKHPVPMKVCVFTVFLPLFYFLSLEPYLILVL